MHQESFVEYWAVHVAADGPSGTGLVDPRAVQCESEIEVEHLRGPAGVGRSRIYGAEGAHRDTETILAERDARQAGWRGIGRYIRPGPVLVLDDETTSGASYRGVDAFARGHREQRRADAGVARCQRAAVPVQRH